MRRNIYGKTRIFAEKELRDYLEIRKQAVLASIESENDEYLLNVNENDYIEHKVSEAEVESLEIYEDQIYASSSEQMIPAEYFPSSFNVYSGKSYKKDVITFHVPFDGNRELLSCMPGSRIVWSMEVEISGNEFCFEIINFSDDSDSIVREKDSSIRSINQQYANVRTEVERYNSSLAAQVKASFESRKDRIKAKSWVLASLGVPIKKASSPPATFAVPSVQKRRKVTISRPSVQESGYTPRGTAK